MRNYMLLYILCSFIIFLSGGLTWSKEGWTNLVLKIILAIMSLWALTILTNHPIIIIRNL